jgi:hypothetical protein
MVVWGVVELSLIGTQIIVASVDRAEVPHINPAFAHVLPKMAASGYAQFSDLIWPLMFSQMPSKTE